MIIAKDRYFKKFYIVIRFGGRWKTQFKIRRYPKPGETL